MFDTLEELFTPEEVAARKADKVASQVQSVNDRLASARQNVVDLESELAVLTPSEEVEAPAEEAVEPQAEESTEENQG